MSPPCLSHVLGLHTLAAPHPAAATPHPAAATSSLQAAKAATSSPQAAKAASTACCLLDWHFQRKHATIVSNRVWISWEIVFSQISLQGPNILLQGINSPFLRFINLTFNVPAMVTTLNPMNPRALSRTEQLVSIMYPGWLSPSLDRLPNLH